MWERSEGFYESRAPQDPIVKRVADAVHFTVEGAAQDPKQELMIEWFCEELDGTLRHGLISYLGIVKRRYKDDRNIAFISFQPGLQLQPRHLRHADVNDQARGLAMETGFEKGSC